MSFWSGTLLEPVERLVSARLGRPWLAVEIRDLSDRASHPCAVLSDGACAMFAKFSGAPDGLEQFASERAGLERLAAGTGVQTPAVVGVLPTGEGGALLVLEAVPEVDRTPRHWRAIGQALARLHQVTWDQFGLETTSYFGPIRMDNAPLPDWPTFYGERRLRPLLRRAVDARQLPTELTREVETVIGRLPELCGPAMPPALLHGDAQQNNFISTETGVVMVDPCVYFGHPEIDLALLDYFQPVPQDVFDGYREVRPIAPGFAERRNLWRVHGHLACVAESGAEYLLRLRACLRPYM